ncbi:arrestin homolog [Schistocerca gregaria]|uniref:arrestin homolog n=1 Tax=Schistocerca gregaria TaxID=7010 RepID=UPI00211E5397|nr:arrestin homolog [Schistocerca gregaria]
MPPPASTPRPHFWWEHHPTSTTSLVSLLNDTAAATSRSSSSSSSSNRQTDMIPLLFVVYVVAVKVFKKTTPNGKVTVYLGKRDFIDHLDHVDPIDGIVVVDNDYLKGRKVFGQLTTTYRYGREEDEVMGLKFTKEMVLAKEQIVPQPKEKMELTPIQERLMKKLGPNAFPFTFHFPASSPSSVTLQPGDDDQGKPLGVEYSVKTWVADHAEEKGHKRSAVTLAIKKLQYAPPTRGRRLPSSLVSKGFTFSQGKINLEVTLDREIYYHGEKLAANIIINNNSRKTVKNIKVYVVQHCEVTMVNAQFSRHVASLETREGCPITPGASFTKVFYLVPCAASNKDRYGIALDGYLKDDDVNLASSTLVSEGKNTTDAIGIVISYSLRVKLNCGTLGGELQTDVPFKLLHPAPGTAEREKAQAIKKMKSVERTRYENSCYAADDDDNIVFEDFARLRLNEPE